MGRSFPGHRYAAGHPADAIGPQTSSSFVYGELLLGSLPKSGAVREVLADLQMAPVADSSEVAAFIEWAGLSGTGIGYVDAHLLVSARMLENGRLLTQDYNLLKQAQRLDIAYQP
jgi:hypothetical protein